MARMIPPSFTSHTVSQGEVDIFHALKDAPQTKDWTVLHSLDIAKHVSQVSGEADFVILVPNLGVLCLEVKACNSLSRSDGAWYYGSDPVPDYRGPFKQAEGAKHSIFNFLRDQIGSNIDAPFLSAVAFTHIPFQDKSPEWHAWQVIDKAKIDRDGVPLCIINALKSGRRHLETTGMAGWLKKSPTAPEISTTNKLTNLLRSEFEYFESPVSRKVRAAAETKKFTEEQFDALDLAEANDRIVYNGPAGTGKTFLAIEIARREASQGKKVLFLCYNEMLSQYLKEQVRPLIPAVYCSTVGGFMLKVAGVTAKDTNDFWDRELPQLAKERLTEADKFDVLVLDEAQDFMSLETVDFVDNALRNGLKKGHVRLFGDFDAQSVQKAEIKLAELKDGWIPDLVMCPLSKNCRNTPRVADLGSGFTNGLVKYRSILRADDRVAPSILPYAVTKEQTDLLMATLGDYKKNGIDLEETAILSCKAKGSAAQDIISMFSKDPAKALSEGQLESGLVCTTIRKFKGLERYGIIVTDIDNSDQESMSELLYIASTRAVGRLTLLVQKDIINKLTIKAYSDAA